MATAVFFHAHPDDEAIQTGGTMARMAAEGHRVVLVTATRGELGEVPEGFLSPGETLTERRALELAAACDALGVARHEYLGYRDSGMAGEPSNDDADCFWQADVDEAASRLASILDEEDADIVATYDENGGYGHPDHIQVHRVGLRAAERAETDAGVHGHHESRLPVVAGRSRRRVRAGHARRAAVHARHLGRAGRAHHHRGRRDGLPRSQAAGHGGARQSDQRHVVLPHDVTGGVRRGVGHRVVHPGLRPRARAGSRTRCSPRPGHDAGTDAQTTTSRPSSRERRKPFSPSSATFAPASTASSTGVSDDDARRRLVASGTTLLGIVKHLALVEVYWSQRRFAGSDVVLRGDGFELGPSDTVASVRAEYAEAGRQTDKVVSSCHDLEQPLARGRHGLTLRWMLAHLVEETARHAGHADILRELVDGATGR